MIDIKNLSITKNKKKLIHDISYTCKSNACTVIIGTNGAGKTCLLQAIAGNIIPTSGTIKIHTSHIGYCKDTPGINEELTPQEQRTLTQNIAHKARNKKNSDERIEKLHLKLRIHQPIKTLSQGNKQKVSLINSIIHDPKLILRDEPTQHLDPQARKIIHQLIEHLKHEGKTIVYTTHFLEDIGDHTDHYCILEQGYLQEHGPITNKNIIQTFFKTD